MIRMDRGTRLFAYMLVLVVIVNLLVALTGQDMTGWLFGSVVLMLAVFSSGLYVDKLKGKSPQLITNMGRFHCNTSKPIEGPAGDGVMPGQDLWGWGGINAEFSTRDGGSSISEGGYFICPKAHPIYLNRDDVYIPTIFHELPSIDACYPWARAAIGREYDPIRSRFHIGFFSLLERPPKYEDIQLQAVLESTYGALREQQKLSEDAITHLQTTFDVAVEQRSPPLWNIRRKRLLKRLRRLLEEDVFAE